MAQNVRLCLCPSSKNEELTYRGRVNALNSNTRQLPADLSALTFPDCVARKFWQNKRIHYEVKIEKRKPVAKSLSVESSVLQKGTEEANKLESGALKEEAEEDKSGKKSDKKRKSKRTKESPAAADDDVKETSC